MNAIKEPDPIFLVNRRTLQRISTNDSLQLAQLWHGTFLFLHQVSLIVQV